MDAAWEKIARRKFDLILCNLISFAASNDENAQRVRNLAAGTGKARIIVLANSAAVGDLPVDGRLRVISNAPIDEIELVSVVEDNLPLNGCHAYDRCDMDIDDVDIPIEFEGIVAVSLAMRAVVRRIMEAASVDIPVLITGETGTGKDLVASAIHKRSARRNKPYIAVNTGAIARELIASEIFGHDKGAFTGALDARPGIFEQAQGGTVFLDEVATMDDKTQVSLLRVLEEKTFRRVGGARNITTDVRIIAATNDDLEESVLRKRFREDLFYRLHVFPIRVPPLRERTSAITALANHFIAKFGSASAYRKNIERVSPDAYRMLRRYSWPGNVRELKNVIQAAVLMADGEELLPELMPKRIREAVGSDAGSDGPMCSFRLGSTLDSVEDEFIRATLSHAGGNKKLAASLLGISRRALYNKIKRP
jgi:DNA-binding NtrC family response regulator